MSIELFGGVKIKVKINGYVNNTTNNEIKLIKSVGVKINDKLIYYKDNVKNSLIITKNEITLIRNSDSYNSILKFKLNKITNNEYYIKELNLYTNIQIKTNYIYISKDLILIKYKVVEDNNDYIYRIEVSEII